MYCASFCPIRSQNPLAPRDARVDEVPLQQHVVLRGERDHHCRKLRSLALWIVIAFAGATDGEVENRDFNSETRCPTSRPRNTLRGTSRGSEVPWQSQ
jgi:hypothetical protein